MAEELTEHLRINRDILVSDLIYKKDCDIATVRGKIQVFDNLYQKLVKALENEYGPRS